MSKSKYYSNSYYESDRFISEVLKLEEGDTLIIRGEKNIEVLITLDGNNLKIKINEKTISKGGNTVT